MAAQSLYRKWRSQTFGELVGQEHVVQTLRNAIVEERIGHAYLFTGPRGVGKTSMARLLAKAVNCTHPDPAARPCGQCEMCLSIAEGHAVDVIEMDAASHTSVEDAREIIERVQFRPALARYKVHVIDEVHMLSTAAFNALLKTLEEPPDHAIFVMATTEVHKVPATILSRCQRFTFTRHGVSSTAAHLRRIAEAENLALEEGVPEAIARSATGSMRDALSVLEQLASFAQGAIRLDQVNSLLGMTSSAEVDALIEALLDGDVGAGLRAINGVADQGADIRQFTRDLVERLRSLLLLIASGDQHLVDAGEDALAQLRGWAQRADTAGLLHWIKIFSGLDFQLRTTPFGHLPLELALVEALVAPAPAAQPASTPGPRTTRPAAPPPRAEPPAGRTPPARAEPAPARAEPPGDLAARATPLDSRSAPPPPAPADPTPPAAATPAGDQPLADADAEPPPPEALTDLPALPPRETAMAANADFTVLERVEAAWNEIIRDVRPKSTTVQALLKGATPIDVEGNIIVLLASSPFHKDNLEKAQNRKIIEDVIKKHLGSIYGIRCTIETKTETRDLRGQIREARKDELVRAALNIFEAHIVDIEPEESGG